MQFRELKFTYCKTSNRRTPLIDGHPLTKKTQEKTKEKFSEFWGWKLDGHAFLLEVLRYFLFQTWLKNTAILYLQKTLNLSFFKKTVCIQYFGGIYAGFKIHLFSFTYLVKKHMILSIYDNFKVINVFDKTKYLKIGKVWQNEI
jgi:hypothetical protein